MKHYFDKSIIEIIKNRHSVRTYYPESIKKELKEKLTAYAAEIQGPFDAAFRLVLIDSYDAADKAEGKIGTYGVIKGAKSYIAGIADKSPYSMEQLGYCMESLMLYAESLGFGCCWLGGTFKRSQFAELVRLQEHELLPVVSPVGCPADKRALVESIMRRLAGSDNRKPWKELFFENTFEKPLTTENAGIYKTPLDMIRLAPSASNKQPWRILKKDGAWHFYLKRTKGYDKALSFSIQKIDMGIAMCHFDMAAEELKIKGNWNIESQPPLSDLSSDMEYIISWIAQ